MEVEEDVFVRENHDLSELLRHFDDDDDDAVIVPSPGKKLRLEAPRGRSIDVLDSARRQPLPREDGYMDTPEERRMADQRPFNRQYMQQQLEAWMALEKWPYYQFVQLFAGSANCRVLDLMDQDDLERRLRERQETAQIRRQELERSIVPLREKERQLQQSRDKETFLRANQKRLLGNDSMATRNLAEIGQQLIDDSFVPVALALARLDTLATGKPDQQPEDDAASVQALERIVADPAQHQTLDQLVVLGCKRRVLFDQLFERASEENVATLVGRMRASTLKNQARLAETELKTAPIVKNESETTTTSSSTTSAVVQITAETLAPDELGKIFGQAVVLMIKLGCEAEYGGYRATSATITRSYVIWVIDFFAAKDANQLAELGREYNIFASGGDFGQPPEVARLIRQATGGSQDAQAVMKAREIMAAHFLWLYFHHRSLAGLALDAYQQRDNANPRVDEALLLLHGQLQEAMREAEPVLALYFQRVRGSLAGEQTLTGEESERIRIVRLPYNVAELPATATFAQQNAAMLGVDHLDMIVDDAFRLYYQTGQTRYEYTLADEDAVLANAPLSWLRPVGSAQLAKLHPVLALHSLFRGYASYERVYTRHLNGRLQHQQETTEALERKIDEITREVNSTAGEQRRSQYVQTRAFTALPVNSGVIKLEPQAVSALDKAYRLVQQHCAGLHGMTKRELEATSESIDSGLGGDFARLAALVLAEIRLAFPDRYNTQHQASYTLQSTASALAALKRYRYSSQGLTGLLQIWTATESDYHTQSPLMQLMDRAVRPGSVQLSLF